MDLQPFFYAAFVLNGFGFLNETSALYGLISIPPAQLKGFLTPEGGVFRLLGGWQNLFIEMAKRINVDIIFNANIQQIRRGKKVQIVFINQKHSNHLNTQEFDFLILTPAMNSLFNIVDFNPHELKIFSQLRNLFFVKSVVNSISPGKRSLSPLENFQFDTNDVEYAVYRSINVHQVNNNITGLDYQLGLKENVDPNGSKYETSVYVQFGKANPWNSGVDAYVQGLLGQHLRDFNKAEPQIVQQAKWGYYFPNFPPEAATSGVLWDILDMQGKYNTWYIGSSVSFESLENVFEYNHLILKHFRN